MGLLGKLVHIGIDLALISTALAGIKRSTGLTLALENIPNKDLRGVAGSYLELGEWAFDFVVVVMGRSRHFKRVR